MIVFEGGKSFSVREIEELRAQLREDLKNLSPEERALFDKLLAEQADATLPPDQPRLLDVVEHLEWKEKPVDLRTFVYDEYYLGKTCDELYKVHFQDLQELFDNGGYIEAIWTGAIGTGKSFCASIGMCRVLYELSCLHDPHGAYHIAHNTPIDLVCFSVTEELATKVAFDYIIEKLQASPYFTEKFPFRKGKQEFQFPNKIRIAARATTDTSALGMNVIAAFLDEGNFLPKPGKAARIAGEKDQAFKIYNSLKRRMKSRFARRGKLPGMMFVVSSKRRTEDFTSKLIEKASHSRDVFVRDYSLWEVKPDDYPKERFWVFVGNETIPSRILETPSEIEEYRGICAAQENCTLIDVPVNFRPDFEADLEESIRDIAGIATVTITPFIQRRDRIKLAADYGDQNGLFHPFSVVEYVAGSGGEFAWDRMIEPAKRPLPDGGYEDYLRPKLNPESPRHVHIDPSLTGDATGLCMAHIAGFKEVRRRDSNRKAYAEMAPVIVVDLFLRIKPPPGDEIILGDVRALVYQLAEHGYPIGYVSMDSHQCLARGTRVTTTRGLLPIEEVRVGDVVASRVGPRPVSTVWAFGVRPTVRVQTTDGDVLEGTAEHRVEVGRGWTPEGPTDVGWSRDPVWAWVSLGDLRPGDILRTVSAAGPVEGVPHPLRGDKRTLGWRPETGRRSRLTAWEFPTTVTPELAEWLGLIWGDGSITRDGVRLTVTRGEAEDAASVFERLFGVRPRYHACRGKDHGWLEVHARWLVAWMALNDLRKPLVPEVLLRSDRRAKAGFLRGLFATDGSVDRRSGRVSFSTSHHALALQVQLLLRAEFGVASRIVALRRGHRGDYVSTGVQYVVSVRGPRSRFLNAVGFSYGRKQEALAVHQARPGRRLWTRVASVESGQAEVYDLQVSDDPSYVANGFVSHNSIDGIQQMNQRGLEAEVLSVDRKPDPYECLKVAIYEGRVIFYTYPVVLKELAHLEKNHITGKVDHPEGGTKDVADALAAVVFSLTERRPINAHPLGLLRSLSYTPTVQSRAEAVVQEAVRASGPPPGTSPVLWMLGGSGRSDDDPLGL